MLRQAERILDVKRDQEFMAVNRIFVSYMEYGGLRSGVETEQSRLVV